MGQAEDRMQKLNEMAQPQKSHELVREGLSQTNVIYIERFQASLEFPIHLKRTHGEAEA